MSIKYPVKEIFQSVQGEGLMVGRLVTFIRMSGCNLSCEWCDTKEAWDTDDVQYLESEEIVDKLQTCIVVITGGEPCIHDLSELIWALRKRSHYIAIETNGTRPVPKGVDWITCSPKPPLYKIHSDCRPNELKYVVDKNFSVEALDLLINLDVPENVCAIWLQPESSDMEENVKRIYSIIEHSKYQKYSHLLRMGFQLHKLFGFK